MDEHDPNYEAQPDDDFGLARALLSWPVVVSALSVIAAIVVIARGVA